MNNSECIELFSNYLLNEKKSPKNTCESYLRDIRQLSEYFGCQDCNFITATTDDLDGYVNHLRDLGKSTASIARVIATVKNFYLMLALKGFITESPAKKIQSQKVESSMPEIMTNKEVELFLSQPECIDAKGYRDHAMLELLYATGMRVSELLDLNINDVYIDIEVVHIPGSKKDRMVPIYHTAVKAVKDYINLVRPQMISDPNEKALFVNVSGDRMSRQGFWKIVKYYSKKAGIEKDITPHTLRHSFAAHLLENGADVKAVQEMLGHMDTSSTLAYKKLINADVQNAYAMAHPKAKK